MKKYVIALYIRLSVDDKISDSLSIENQRALLHNYTASMKEYSNVEVIEFVDNGYSGTNFERPAIQKIFELVQNNKINCVIVKDFSRFGRNILEVGYFTEKVFPTLNIRFISVSDDFDSDKNKNDTGGIGVAFQYLVNEQYSLDLSMKVKSGVYTKMKNGQFKTSFSPYGFTKDMNGNLIIDEEAAKIVRFIFQKALEVQRITDVPIILNQMGILTPSQYKKNNNCKIHSNAKDIQLWTVQSIKKILKNEFYIGTFIGRRYKIKEVGGASLPNCEESELIKLKSNHPHIVDEDVFYKVQEILVTGETNPYIKNEYLLRNKVKCGICNHALARVNKEKTFKCKYTLNDDRYSCQGMKIKESELEDIILIIIKNQAKLILGMRYNEIEKKKANLKGLNELNEKINIIEKEKIKYYEKFVRSEISIEQYNENKKIFDEELREINILQKSINLKEEVIVTNNIINLLEEVIAKDQLTRELIEVLIDKILVFPHKKIEILWGLKGFIKEK